MEYSNYARYLEESLGFSDQTLDTLSKVWRIESIKTILKMLALRPELTAKEPFEFQALKCSLGPVINQLSASELQDRGVLAQCHVNIVQLNVA